MPPPQVDGVVDLETLVFGQELGRQLGGELDPQYGGEVLAALERPSDREGFAGEAVPGPEALHRAGVVRRQPAPEPAAEGGTRGVVVDDEGGAAAAHHPGELGES